MKHTVSVQTETGREIYLYQNLSKKAAIETAKEESKLPANKNNYVYVTGYNGQCTVYLNPTGDYDCVGKKW